MSGPLKFIGNATPTKDVWTITFALTWAAGDTATITGPNGKTLVLTAGTAAATTDLATAMAAAWSSTTLGTLYSVAPATGGQGIPEFKEYTAAVSASTVVLTAYTAGQSGPTFTAGEVTVGSGTCTIAHTTTATGPYHYDNVLNYDTGALPIAGDDLTIDEGCSIKYALDQSGAALTLASLTLTSRVDSSCQLGLPIRNGNGYHEYRQTELLGIGVTTFTSYSGSGLVRINFGTVQTAATIYSTGTSIDSGRAACQLRGTHASNVLNILSLTASTGSPDVSWGGAGETATVATVRAESGTFVIGSAVTLTTLTANGATGKVYCAGTTCTLNSGTLYMYAGAWTTITENGGTLYDYGTSTYTTVTLNNDSVYNADGNLAAKTITTLNLNDTCSVVNTARRLVVTNSPTIPARLTAAAS